MKSSSDNEIVPAYRAAAYSDGNLFINGSNEDSGYEFVNTQSRQMARLESIMPV